MHRKLRLHPPEHVIKPKHAMVQDALQRQHVNAQDAGAVAKVTNSCK